MRRTTGRHWEAIMKEELFDGGQRLAMGEEMGSRLRRKRQRIKRRDWRGKSRRRCPSKEKEDTETDKLKDKTRQVDEEGDCVGTEQRREKGHRRLKTDLGENGDEKVADGGLRFKPRET